MNKQVKRWERYSMRSLAFGEKDERGRLFMSELGMRDLSKITVLHSGLDTVKQLYRGSVKAAPLAEIERLYQEGFGECIELGGHQWLIGSGGKSGYEYRLQNSDLGLILFIKSRYSERDNDYSHLKIECSPHWIDVRDSQTMRAELDRLAEALIEKPETKGCAVHICVDVQGWEVPKDFTDRLVTYARRCRTHEAGKVIYLDMGEVALNYSRGQSYLFGSASTVQLALYRKDVQARAVDKLDFWESVWRRVPGKELEIPAYDSKQPVWRIELRFHHSVLEEFGRGEYEHFKFGTDPRKSCSRIDGVAKRLTGLWRYGMDVFRLEDQKAGSGRYIDAVWQLLAEDVECREPFLPVSYKRIRKTPGMGNEKNVALALGNWLSIMARNRVTPKCALVCLKQSGIYDDVFYMMQRRAWADCRDFDEAEIFDFIEKGLRRRTLLGRAA